MTRTYLAPVLIALVALTAAILGHGGPGGQPAEAATATAVGIDADPSGNTPTTLGTIDTCRSVSVGTKFSVDIYVQGVSGGISGFSATMLYNGPSGTLRIPTIAQGGTATDVQLLLASAPGSFVMDYSDPLPGALDTSGLYTAAAADQAGPDKAENGDGVLARVWFKAMSAGKSSLLLTIPGIGPTLTGSDGLPIQPADAFGVFTGTVTGAQIYVGQDCPGTNSSPSADAKLVTATEDTPLVVTLTGSDPEGVCPLSFVTSAEVNGTLGSLSTPSCIPTAPSSASATVTFVPGSNICAPDQGSFLYTVSDGVQTSSPATVTVDITCVNDPPLPADTAASTAANNPVTITVAATDIENDCPIDFSVGSSPSDGSLGSFTSVTCTPDTPTAGTSTATADITYTPNPGFKGPDSFKFRAADPEPLVSDLATVSISVTPVSAEDKSESTPEDPASPLTVTLSATDVDNNCPLDFAIDSGPSNGSLGSITNVTCTADTPTAGTSTATADVNYTPNPNFNGSDSFSYSASNQVGDLPDIATVSITVTPVNDPPQADPKSTSTPATSSVIITLSATDVDNDCPLSFSIVAPPGGGSLGGIGPVTCTQNSPSPGTSTSSADVEYTPELAFSGIDTFTYRATDPSLADSNIPTVSITVISADGDSDGLLDMFEASNDCLDTDPDSDGDGLTDGQEVILLGTSCDLADTDSDGYSDAFEMTITGTSTGASSTTLVDADSSYPQPPASPNSIWATDQWAGFLVTITGDIGAGQTRLIVSNSADTLNIDSGDPWITDPTASTYAIHKVGTDPFAACAADAVANNEDPDALPPDLNDDQSVDILDIIQEGVGIFASWGARLGDANYSARSDLNADQSIDILDIIQDGVGIFASWGDRCTP